MARPREHAAISLAIAAVLVATTKSRAAGLAALGVGTLIDADHLVDLAVTLRSGERDWLVMPLHGWEYAVALGLLLARRPGWALAATALSYTVHVSTDHVVNGLGPPKIYSVLYRAKHGFRASRLGVPIKPHKWIGTNPLTWF